MRAGEAIADSRIAGNRDMDCISEHSCQLSHASAEPDDISSQHCAEPDPIGAPEPCSCMGHGGVLACANQDPCHSSDDTSSRTSLVRTPGVYASFGICMITRRVRDRYDSRANGPTPGRSSREVRQSKTCRDHLYFSAPGADTRTPRSNLVPRGRAERQACHRVSADSKAREGSSCGSLLWPIGIRPRPPRSRRRTGEPGAAAGRAPVRQRPGCGLVHAAVLCLLALAAGSVAAQDVASIGVLTYRGPADAMARWEATAQYLNAAIPHTRFRIVPLTVDSLEAAVDGAALSFLITSSGSLVDLAARNGIARVLTLKSARGAGGVGNNRIGAVIFTLATREDLHSLSDLKGRTLAATSPDSFDDFQIAWGEMRRQGLDPYRDLAAIKFAGMPKDAVVRAVEASEADAGVARSGLLEMMAAEGHLDLSRFRVLNARVEAGFPYRLSTRLYPEWALATLPQTPGALSEKVVAVLLAMSPDDVAAKRGTYAGWTVPVSDKPVHELMRDLGIGPYKPVSADAAVSWSAAGLWVAAVAVLVLIAWRRRDGRAVTVATGAHGAAGSRAVRSDDRDALEPILARMQTLTEREREVLALIAQGEPNKAVARKLDISPRTVEYHRANVMQKMQVGSGGADSRGHHGRAGLLGCRAAGLIP